MKSLFSLAMVAWISIGVGCGDDSSGTGGSGSASNSDGSGSGGADLGWILGTCGTCFEDKCAGAIAACEADPGCASTYACLEACPAAPTDGPAEEGCSAACTVPDSSTAQAAYDALESCRLTGDGQSGCVTCRGDEPAQCEPHPEPTNCTECTERECCALTGAYRSNPEATAMRDCIVAGGCGGYDACVIHCAALHPDGVADFGAALGCASLRCQGEANCGNPGDPIDACVTCWNDNCFDERIACDAVPDCTLFDACASICVTEHPEPEDLEERQACFDTCGAAHPEGAALSNTFLNCSVTRCEAECG